MKDKRSDKFKSENSNPLSEILNIAPFPSTIMLCHKSVVNGGEMIKRLRCFMNNWEKFPPDARKLYENVLDSVPRTLVELVSVKTDAFGGKGEATDEMKANFGEFAVVVINAWEFEKRTRRLRLSLHPGVPKPLQSNKDGLYIFETGITLLHGLHNYLEDSLDKVLEREVMFWGICLGIKPDPENHKFNYRRRA